MTNLSEEIRARVLARDTAEWTSSPFWTTSLLTASVTGSQASSTEKDHSSSPAPSALGPASPVGSRSNFAVTTRPFSMRSNGGQGSARPGSADGELAMTAVEGSTTADPNTTGRSRLKTTSPSWLRSWIAFRCERRSSVTMRSGARPHCSGKRFPMSEDRRLETGPRSPIFSRG